LLKVVGEVARLELAAAAHQHIAQPARLDLLGQRLRRNAEGPTDLGLRDQQPALGELGELLPEIGVDGGCGGSHLRFLRYYRRPLWQKLF
jgi:hypothetical protein